jgi:hypothetical protein
MKYEPGILVRYIGDDAVLALRGITRGVMGITVENTYPSKYDAMVVFDTETSVRNPVAHGIESYVYEYEIEEVIP